MLVDFSAGDDLLVDRTVVSAARALSVQEVIARHRQQQTRQDARYVTTALTSVWSSTFGRTSPIPVRRRHRKHVLRRRHGG